MTTTHRSTPHVLDATAAAPRCGASRSRGTPGRPPPRAQGRRRRGTRLQNGRRRQNSCGCKHGRHGTRHRLTQITSHTDYIDSLLRSLTSIPALGPYIQERRPQYQRLSDLSSHPRHGELTSETPATSHAEPLESGTLARRAGKGRAFAAETAGSSRLGRESEAARAAKKRKLTEPSTSSQRSRHHAEGRAGGSAAQGKPRQGRTYNDDTDQATSDEAPEDGDGDRLVRGAHRARARVGAPGADSKTTTATWSGRRATDGDDEAPRSTVQSRPAKTTQGGSRGDQDDQRYCFCNNVSYGDMIGCDDDDCEREWFHLGCVGLNKPPQGTWYCDACQERRALQARQKAKRGVARSGRAGSATLETVAAVPPRRATGARR